MQKSVSCLLIKLLRVHTYHKIQYLYKRVALRVTLSPEIIKFPSTLPLVYLVTRLYDPPVCLCLHPLNWLRRFHQRKTFLYLVKKFTAKNKKSPRAFFPTTQSCRAISSLIIFPREKKKLDKIIYFIPSANLTPVQACLK